MRNPMKTSKTVSVQLRVDNINRLLYNETRDIHTEVQLGIADDRIFVICFSRGIECVIYECESTKHLYHTLDHILSDLMYEKNPNKTWWKWHSEKWYDPELDCFV